MVEYIHKNTGVSYHTKLKVCAGIDIKYIMVNLDTNSKEIVNGLDLMEGSPLYTFPILYTKDHDNKQYNVSVTFINSTHKPLGDVVGSDYKLINKANGSDVSSGHTDYGLPLVVYYKDQSYSTTFINKLHGWPGDLHNVTTNMHPHGLNCDSWVDGASMLNEFGKDAMDDDLRQSKSITLDYKIYNNSMFSAWHPHAMFRAGRLLYRGLFMPYVVEDIYSTTFSSTFGFALNDNDIPISFGAINFDGDRMQKINPWSAFPTCCQTFYYKEDPDIEDYYPNLGGNNGPGFLALSLWNASTLQINGTPVHGYSDNFWGEFRGMDRQTILTHKVSKKNWNFIRLRLVHTGCSVRRNYFGVVDDANKFLSFLVIGAGGGFITPWNTKMISVESMNRADIVIDVHTHKSVYLVSFDFDLATIEKLIIPQPFVKEGGDPRDYRSDQLNDMAHSYNRDFFDNYSIFTGCSNHQQNITILDNEACYEKFRIIANNYRHDNPFKTDNGHNMHMSWSKDSPRPAFFKVIKFMPDSSLFTAGDPSKNSSTYTLDDISASVMSIVKKPSSDSPDETDYYYNRPNAVEASNNVRYISLNPGMEINVDCWDLNDDDITSYTDDNVPTIKFNLVRKYHMLNNTEFCFYKETDNVDNVVHMAHMKSMDHMKSIDDTYCDGSNLSIDATDGQPPIDLNHLKSLMKKALKGTNVTWTWEKYYRPIGEREGEGDKNGCVEKEYRHCGKVIKSVRIILHNKNDYAIRFTGNKNVMKLLGVEMNWGGGNPPPLQIDGNDVDDEDNIRLRIDANARHVGDPFMSMNDNIMNFTVTQGVSERWVFYSNSNLVHMDNHPLHFHMTSGFVVPSGEGATTTRNGNKVTVYTSPTNTSNMISTESIDVMGINSGDKKALVFDVKFPNFSSEATDHNGHTHYLGYMFHCHYMMHHDQNMMGQFYVDKKK